VLSLWGALSDERSGLSPVSHFHQCLVHYQRVNIKYIVHVTCFKQWSTFLLYDTDLIEFFDLVSISVAAGACMPRHCLSNENRDAHIDTQADGKDS
jgi:hypothetical protein